MKNWNWKSILNYIAAAILALTGGAVGSVALESSQKDPAAVEYAAPAPANTGKYKVLAAFYTVRPVKAGNFRDAETDSDLGAYELYVVKPRPDLVLAAFLEKYGVLYPYAKVKGIDVLYSPPKLEPAPDEPEKD